LFDIPNREYFRTLTSGTGFNIDVLEKVYRLFILLKDVLTLPDFDENLALKGGTVLQFMHPGVKRRSIDIDFNYMGQS